MKPTSLIIIMITLLLVTVTQPVEASKLTIIHSNDLHSHFLGAPANLDYTPTVQATIRHWVDGPASPRLSRTSSRNGATRFWSWTQVIF